MTHTRSLFVGLALLAPVSEALACGGFFCRTTPIEQSGEKIVFAIDELNGKVEVHVQIAFEGSAEDFAWLVPVPSRPEPFITTDELFNTLDAWTQPSFVLSQQEDGTCLQPEPTDDTWGWDSATVDFDSDDADTFSPLDSGAAPPPVVVVERTQVGPYDTVVLQATSEDALLDWLQEEAYALPDELSPALAPYVASGSYFLALKLQNDRSVGELAPLGMAYTGNTPVIPLTLTRIAATPDLRLVPYVFSHARAVPTNYLHVVIDELAVDWFGRGSNYESLVAMAADEAGGQAFATDSSQPTSEIGAAIYWQGRYDLARLRSHEDLNLFLEELFFSQGFTSTATLLEILRRHIAVPSALAAIGISDVNYYNCVACYRRYAGYVEPVVDFEALVDDIELRIVEPAQRAQSLFTAHAHVTRLVSSVSPEEMTLDPMFAINSTLPDVARMREAQLTFLCRPDSYAEDVPRRLDLPDGRQVLLPPVSGNEPYTVMVEDLVDGAALTIEQMTADGAPIPVIDRTDDSNRVIDEHNEYLGLEYGVSLPPNADEPETEAVVAGWCGCSSRGGSLSWLPLGLLGLIGTRRRRD